MSKANESVAVLRSQLETERKNVDERIATVKENANQQLDAERKHGEELRAELQKQAEAKNKLLQEEVRNMAAHMLAQIRENMKTDHKELIEYLLTPHKDP